MLRYKLTWSDYDAAREFWILVFTQINILTKWFHNMCHNVWLVRVISFPTLPFASGVFIPYVSETESVSFIRCEGIKGPTQLYPLEIVNDRK
jgi:hypothetical protein